MRAIALAIVITAFTLVPHSEIDMLSDVAKNMTVLFFTMCLFGFAFCVIGGW